ncbi:MAG: amidohydrolase [Candidatus Tectomicrobia bacterium]|nr:amidohydrolase [Candidatus Tectomicrobia bacterium]
MRIDAHAHEYPAPFLECIESLVRRGKYPAPSYPLNPWDPDGHLGLLDEEGIDLQVISPMAAVYPTDRKEASALTRGANDPLWEACRAHPDRYTALAYIPLVPIDLGIAELERAAGESATRGVVIGTTVNGKPLDDPGLAPFFEALDRTGLPALLHPMDAFEREGLRDFRLDIAVGWLFETTLAVSRLILSGMLDRYPRIPFILSHLGGGTHYLMERIILAGNRGRMKDPVRDYFRRFYYDTAGPVSAQAVACGLSLVGPERILLGTDYPFGPEGGREFIRRAIACVEGATDSAEERERIFSGNARRLFGGP